MSDTFDLYQGNPDAVPPLTRAVIAGMPTTMEGVVIGPCISDRSLRAMMDALSNLESRVAALEAP